MNEIKTNDDQIAASIRRVRELAELYGWFSPAPNRSDGMLIGDGQWKGWQLETRFIHGEGTVDLMYGRTAGERQVGWRAVQKVRGEWTSTDIVDWFTVQKTLFEEEHKS